MTLIIDKDKKKELTLGRKINPSDFSVETIAPPADHDAELVAEVRAVADAIKAIEPGSTDLTQVVGALNSVASVLDRVAASLAALNWKTAHGTIVRNGGGQMERIDFVKD